MLMQFEILNLIADTFKYHLSNSCTHEKISWTTLKKKKQIKRKKEVKATPTLAFMIWGGEWLNWWEGHNYLFFSNLCCISHKREN